MINTPINAEENAKLFLTANEKIFLNEFIATSSNYIEKDDGYIFEHVKTLGSNTFSKESLYIKATNNTTNDLKKNIEDILNATKGNLTYTDDGWDKTGAIYATLTVKYTTYNQNGLTYIKMSNITGTHSGINGGVRVQSQSLTCGSLGFYVGGYQSVSQTYYPSGGNWSVTPPFILAINSNERFL